MPKTAIVAYVPVLHAGYKRLFEKYPDALIYVFGPEIIARFDQLRKELRALPPEDVITALKGWGREARLFTAGNLDEIQAYSNIVLPNEDVSYELAGELKGSKLTFEPIFLRWDRRKLESKKDPLDPDRTISENEFDRQVMAKTSEIAKRSTNIYRRLGAALVKDRKVLLQTHNGPQPTQHSSWIDGDPRNNANRGTSIDLTTDIHAEAKLIAEAARRGIALKEASIYVTDFPCPTCAKLIANSGLKKCYYARGYSVLDGQQVLNASGVELIHVVGAEMAEDEPEVWVPYPEKRHNS